ncbi:hypothetical protein J3R83DRAFT_11973 [Lanmaoa asiatica]|nr:hypothetical protein J3R83DRAFT_11973 [Lanmaoa asiatica]
MQLGTFTADIIIDGKVLEQYDVVSESPTKVTCWIASEEGKSSSVKWECHEEPRSTTIQGRLWVDGMGCARATMVPTSLGIQSNVFSSSAQR